MKYRELGTTGLSVSAISFGAWAIGGTWGNVSQSESQRALATAADQGVNFFDTADVYGDGLSERLVGELVRSRQTPIYVATKAGRRLSPHTADGYTRANLEAFVERSLTNLGMDAVDLLQLHCPPIEVYYRPEVFGALDDLKAAGKIRHYGVSVEKVEEGLIALEYPGVESIQLIFNLFRMRPAELLLERARARSVGIIARVPLASGMLTGKLSPASTFEPDDHRNFNRRGEAFDVGETFSGVPFDVGLEAVEKLRALVPPGQTLIDLALAWILSHPEVTCAIPGAKSPEQVAHNVRAAELDPLAPGLLDAIRAIYDEHISRHVHTRW